ncbi:DUF4936 family protein [Neisseriaceae bacterium TC5R-5]|nr:DUF4936 family protein [Neisseriaceae bacterium TC5R-5]
MSYTLYCYFKVNAPAQPILTALQAMQRELLASTRIAGQLLRRRDDAATWMEVYAGIESADTFRQHWLAARQRHNLPPLLCHEEWFEALTD